QTARPLRTRPPYQRAAPASGGALAAGAAQDDVVPGHGVAGAALDLVDDRLELVVLERLDLAAVVADEVVVVLAGREGGLVTRPAGADVDPLHEPAFGELLEHAVDGGDADPATAAGAQPVEDLLRGQAAVLPTEQLDDGAARAAAAALRLERGKRLLAP